MADFEIFASNMDNARIINIATHMLFLLEKRRNKVITECEIGGWPLMLDSIQSQKSAFEA